MRWDIEVQQYGTALLLLLLGVATAWLLLWVSSLVSPHNPTKEKQLTYECGENPMGSAWLRFNIRFYVVALVFVLFDVEMALVYPVAAIFKALTAGTGGPAGCGPALIVFGELLFFLAVLFLGLVYIWGRGDLGWIRTFRVRTEPGMRSWQQASTGTADERK
jgi:NADH-quinone oxidoreductase subunit A